MDAPDPFVRFLAALPPLCENFEADAVRKRVALFIQVAGVIHRASPLGAPTLGALEKIALRFGDASRTLRPPTLVEAVASALNDVAGLAEGDGVSGYAADALRSCAGPAPRYWD